MRYDLRNAAFALAVTVLAGSARMGARRQVRQGGATTAGGTTAGTTTSGGTTSGTTATGTTGAQTTTTPSATMPNSTTQYTPQHTVSPNGTPAPDTANRYQARLAADAAIEHKLDPAGLPGRRRGLADAASLQHDGAHDSAQPAGNDGQSAMHAGAVGDAVRKPCG